MKKIKLIEYKCNMRHGCRYSFYTTIQERVRCPKCFRRVSAVKVIDVFEKIKTESYGKDKESNI